MGYIIVFLIVHCSVNAFMHIKVQAHRATRGMSFDYQPAQNQLLWAAVLIEVAVATTVVALSHPWLMKLWWLISC